MHRDRSTPIRSDELLELDDARFAAAFPSRALMVRHGLASHPLLTPGALAGLAEASHPNEQARAEVPAVHPEEEVADFDVDLATLVRDVRGFRCRVTLRHIEGVAQYRELIDTVLRAAASVVEQVEGPLRKTAGFIFLSADEAVTPVHCDPEYNFLLQLRGTKRVHIGQLDRATVQQAMERQIGGGNRNLATLPDQVETFVLTPGLGVFIPPETPHWVENGTDESASLSLTFYTRRTARAEHVHDCNRLLRRIGLSPAPPGGYALRDRAKASAVRIGPAVKRRLALVVSPLAARLWPT